MNSTKTIISNPELKIQACEDGVWLHFKTKKRTHSSINLPMFFGPGRSMSDKTIVDWCLEYVEECK